jgi:hypothetical protein
MSILSPVVAQFQSLVKKLSDSALAQALQMHADPSDPKGFWLAQEAMGRSAARKEAQTTSANQPTVVQQLAQNLAPAPMGAMPPQMPPQGITAAMPPAPPQMPQAAPPIPPQGIAGVMPPQGMPPQMPAAPMPPQAPPVAMAQAGGHVHDYGVASLPYEPRYEEGGIVSFAEGGGLGGRGTGGRNTYGVPVSDIDDYLTVARSFGESEIESPEEFQNLMQQNIARQKEIENQTKKEVATSGMAYGREPPKTEPPKDGFSGEELPSEDPLSSLFKGTNFGVSTGTALPLFDAETAKDQLTNYTSNLQAPSKETFETIAARRRSAEANEPNYDPNYENKINELYRKKEIDLQKDKGLQALSDIGAALSAAGENPDFRRGISAYGTTLARLGTESSDKFRQLQNDIDKGKMAVQAAKQAAAEGRIQDSIQIISDNEESVRAFENSIKTAKFQGLGNIADKFYQSKVDQAKEQNANNRVNAEIGARVKLAEISAILTDRKAQYALKKASEAMKGKTDKVKYDILLKIVPNVAEEAAADFNSRQPGGLSWENLPPDKQQIEILRYGLGKVQTYEQLASRGLSSLSDISGDAVIGIEPVDSGE